MSIELSFVDVSGRSVETRSSTHHSFPSLALTFLPLVDEAVIYSGIKGDDCEGRKLSQFVQLCEERRQHRVRHRARLVDGYSDVGSTVDPFASVNVGETLVDPTNRGTLG